MLTTTVQLGFSAAVPVPPGYVTVPATVVVPLHMLVKVLLVSAEERLAVHVVANGGAAPVRQALGDDVESVRRFVARADVKDPGLTVQDANAAYARIREVMDELGEMDRDDPHRGMAPDWPSPVEPEKRRAEESA